MPTQNIDLMPVFYGATIRSWIARKLELELPNTEIKLTGKQIELWSGRLIAAMEQEWAKIKSELK